MASAETPDMNWDEVLDFLAFSSSPEQWLHYRPSKQIQRRARALLAKEKIGPLSPAEQEELDAFGHVVLFVQDLSAEIHARRAERQ